MQFTKTSPGDSFKVITDKLGLAPTSTAAGFGSKFKAAFLTSSSDIARSAKINTQIIVTSQMKLFEWSLERTPVCDWCEQ